MRHHTVVFNFTTAIVKYIEADPPLISGNLGKVL
jgi:hypothetical protein